MADYAEMRRTGMISDKAARGMKHRPKDDRDADGDYDGDKPGKGKRKSYSAKQAAKGKDIGKPGKNFEKIEEKFDAKHPNEKGGGARVAGAVLNKLRAKHG